jgi:hypothetical protein
MSAPHLFATQQFGHPASNIDYARLYGEVFRGATAISLLLSPLIE